MTAEIASAEAGNAEVTTVGHDMAVVHEGTTVRRLHDLAPDTEHEVDGITFRTLPRPDGELLCRFATTNDVHFGETECGHLDGIDTGPPMSVGPGERPYPTTMNEGAVSEIAAIDPAAVVVKGDLTTNGTIEEYQQFLDCYAAAFGDRLHHVRGNHDGYHGATFAATPTQQIDLPGVTIALIDTTIPRAATGTVTDEQLEWLGDVAAAADRPVLVLGHHHPWDPASAERPDGYFGIHPDASEALVSVIAAHDSIRGYFAGHTHRNRRRTFAATGDVAYVEVACVKDFPGAWAEYQVFEGGILQIMHRISTPEALEWTQRTRSMFFGAYPQYSFGKLTDRCFAIET
ncbi:metallophosphoesterase family protein [Actinospongicola halichondriae]|uniref:metallophosphoesterase family protein n=1 Tax=Actinospongicola halichondriae TaxID=3236844 RepID=UPI003D3BFA30